MSERKWSIIQVLAYFYNAFASLSDGKLDDAEIETMAKKIIEWSNKDEDDIKYVISCISLAITINSIYFKAIFHLVGILK